MLKLLRRETRKKTQSFIILDIGTEMVKALVCEYNNSSIVVRGVGKISQKPGDMQSGAVMDIASVIENCTKAIAEGQKMGQIYPTDVIMGIAGELVKGMTNRTTYVRKEPEAKIDLGELKNIIHKVQRKSFEETRAQLAYDTGYNEIDVKLVNADIVDVRIDGYKVANPIGFQGKDVQISIFNSFAPLVHFGAMQTIAAELELNLIAIASEPFAVGRCIENEDDFELNGIFMDVGAGTTDIAVVRNGVLEGTKMFTIGGRTFTKRLATTLNISYQEAEDIKIAYSMGKLEKNSEKIVRDALNTDSEVWITGVIFSLAEFYNVDVLPSKIFLCGGGAHLPQIKRILDHPEWSSQLAFAKQPSISLLNPKHILRVKDETGLLNNPEDVTPLALAKLGLEYVGEEHLLTRILKNVIRLMQI